MSMPDQSELDSSRPVSAALPSAASGPILLEEVGTDSDVTMADAVEA